jgi:hypothetical protein
VLIEGLCLYDCLLALATRYQAFTPRLPLYCIVLETMYLYCQPIDLTAYQVGLTLDLTVYQVWPTGFMCASDMKEETVENTPPTAWQVSEGAAVLEDCRSSGGAHAHTHMHARAHAHAHKI